MYASSGGSAEAARRTVYVQNLSSLVDEAVLAALFANCGAVTVLRLPPGGGASRSAWVEFADPRCGLLLLWPTPRPPPSELLTRLAAPSPLPRS